MESIDESFKYCNTKSFRDNLQSYYKDIKYRNDLPLITHRVFKELLYNFYDRRNTYFVSNNLITMQNCDEIFNSRPTGNKAPKELHIDFDKISSGQTGDIDIRTHQLIYATPNTDCRSINSKDYGGFKTNYDVPKCVQDILLALDLLSPAFLFKNKRIRRNYYQMLKSQSPSINQFGYHVDSNSQYLQSKKYLKQLPLLNISVMIAIQNTFPSAGIQFQDRLNSTYLYVRDVLFFRGDKFHYGLGYDVYGIPLHHRAFIQSTTIIHDMDQYEVAMCENNESTYRKFKGKRKREGEEGSVGSGDL